MRVWGIVLNTFRETVRRPFYYLLLATAAGALLITLRLPLFTFGNDTDMYKDLGLSFILVFVLLMALLAAATGVASEVEEKTAQTVLSKAVGRGQFVLGKYLGVMAASLVALAVLGAVFAAAVYYRVRIDAGVLERTYAHGGVGAQVEAFRERQFGQALTVLPGLVLVMLQVGVLGAVATAISTRFSPVASVGMSLGVFLVGHLTVFLESGMRSVGAWGRAARESALAVVPFLEIFNLNQKLSHSILMPGGEGPAAEAWREVWGYVGWAGLYALGYAVFALGVGVVLFRRRSLA